MADVATDNILRDINAKNGTSGDAQMVDFQPAVNMLKLSLGLGKMVFQGSVMADDTPEADQPERYGRLGRHAEQQDRQARCEWSHPRQA